MTKDERAKEASITLEQMKHLPNFRLRAQGTVSAAITAAEEAEREALDKYLIAQVVSLQELASAHYESGDDRAWACTSAAINTCNDLRTAIKARSKA